MAETKTRRQWTPEEKLQVVREARQADQTVSDVCRRHGIAVGQFYLWEKQSTQGALDALRQAKRGRKPTSLDTILQAEVQRLRVVVTELSVENLQLKKGLLL
jgi:transposase-like protein